MAIDSHYVSSSDLESYYVSKDSGLPLAAGTVTFYEDNSRITLKTVYELSGSPPNYTFTPLPNPITLSSVGTPQNAGGDNITVYYRPYDTDESSETFGDVQLYYVVVKDSHGVEQLTREAWPPDAFNGGSGTDTNAVPVQNQISNSQFTRTFLNPGNAATTQDSETMSYVTAGGTTTVEFAPDWSFEIGGTGTVTVQRKALAGLAANPTNPPYSIKVTTTGVSSCKLIQRFNSNSGLWGSTVDNTIYLSSMMVAKNNSLTPAGVQMAYKPSSGNAPTTIFDQAITGSGYVQYSDGSQVEIPQSMDTNKGTDGYVDIYIQLPVPCDLEITSIQVVPSFNATSAAIVTYDETSSNRDQALMGDYYIPRLEAKPINSLLTAWDFPLNPAQQFGTSVTMTATDSYIWDQTVAARKTANVTVTRDSVSGGISFLHGAVSDAFYIAQYLSGAEAKKVIGNRLSVNINGYTAAAGSGTITGRVYLLRGTSTASFGTGTSSTGAVTTPLGTIAANGTFTITAANWQLIPRSGLDTATCTLNKLTTNADIDNPNNYGFNGWEITDASQIADTDKVAIVATFACGAAVNQFTINSISLVPGDIPCRPAPKTVTEVLSDCQYYYERSYDLGTASGTATTNSSATQLMQALNSGTGFSVGAAAFSINYKGIKRAVPTITFYSTKVGTSGSLTVNSTADNVTWATNDKVVASFWGTVINAGTNSTTYQSNSGTSIIGAGTYSAYLSYHYVSDARLGIVA